jgi:Pyruvate/2-oxoacid:ferredoxin oxidoreductase delta subunit
MCSKNASFLIGQSKTNLFSFAVVLRNTTFDLKKTRKHWRAWVIHHMFFSCVWANACWLYCDSHVFFATEDVEIDGFIFKNLHGFIVCFCCCFLLCLMTIQLSFGETCITSVPFFSPNVFPHRTYSRSRKLLHASVIYSKSFGSQGSRDLGSNSASRRPPCISILVFSYHWSWSIFVAWARGKFLVASQVLVFILAK